jgi:Tfp pilus assembly protein PilO
MKEYLAKIFKLFNQLNDQARYSILGAVVLLIILMDVFILVLPQIGGIADIKGRLRKITADTQQVLTDRQRINQLRKNLQETRDQLSSLSTRVRPIQEVPAILSTISSAANQYGVKIDQLVPEKNQQESLKTTPEGKYYALPVVIKAHCGYHMFGRFLGKLENEDLFFIMRDFIIQDFEKDPNIHLFSLTIKIILVDRTLGQTKSL